MTSHESAVVLDYKGELLRLTGDHREKVFGHQIVALDVSKLVTQTPARLNPLDFINKDSPTALEECRELAEALVVRSSQDREPHWADSAVSWIFGMIALVVYYGEPSDRSLQTVRALLTSTEKRDLAVKLMCSSDAWHGMLKRMGEQLLNYKDKELMSVLTTLNRFLNFLDLPNVFDSTGASSFSTDQLRIGKMTIYLVVPLSGSQSLLRMWIGSLLRAVVRGGLQERTKVNFILDEAANLSHMQQIDDAVDKYRGYGVRLQFYFQSLGQLKKCFPDGQDQTLLSNVTQMFFGVNDLQTAEYISNRLGDQTQVLRSGGTGTGTSRQRSDKGDSSYSSSTNENDNWALHGRKLLKPEEVLSMLPQRVAITFTPGVPPIATRLIRYFEESFVPTEPTRFERLKATANVVAASASVMLLILMIAFVLLKDGQNLVPVKWHLNRHRQQDYYPYPL